ncbi:MAG: right-handed parallel beta-helix repeat-containing protein [Candidatus Eisenbacteria bacterium]|uniref:Right-handed parallel beta-helix repeat-containing protein n=1 Tax=Eiseniibacteriota bacterium TaxID=2212470 RepID=A0A956M0V3_UNCEI|nr:right-handed parallel beta-helix repeat-containing protein [Candidatus Eisenbacteria bacterium]
MHTSRRFLRRAILALGLVILSLVPSVVRAGPNAGGTLLVHALEMVYSDGQSYCGPVPAGCDGVDARVDDAVVPVVWLAVAVFGDENQPRLRGVEFGIEYSGIGLVDWGTCAPTDYPTAGWPASGTGTSVVWVTNQTEHVVPVYWFAGYTYSATVPHFSMAPHPYNGGHFADDHVPSVLDEIAEYGTLGFYVDGSAPCPEAKTYVVRPDGHGDRPTIQSAIAVAAPGSVIELTDGVFRGPGNRDVRLSDTRLTIRSASGNPAACVIDCEGTPTENHRGFYIEYDWTAGPTIEGITVRNGYAGADFGYDAEGGAIRQHGPSVLYLRNCVFENCYATHTGGGIDSGGLLEVTDCVFRDCAAGGIYGGGLYQGADRVVLSGCRFEGNHAERGGGVALTHCEATVTDCRFEDNQATAGGGMFLYRATVALDGNTWSHNTAGNGGGLYLDEGSAQLGHATFVDNTAGSGTDVYCWNAPGSLSLYNAILAFGQGGEAFHCGQLEIDVAYTDMFGNAIEDWPPCLSDQATRPGNFSADPRFCDRSHRDYGLNGNSPCAVYWSASRGIVGAWPVGCGESPDPLRDRWSLASDTTALGEENQLASSAEPALAVGPNPFRDRTVLVCTVGTDAPRDLRLAIFDASGRQVRQLHQEAGAVGTRSTTWDGRDQTGSLLPAGTYFARLQVGRLERTARLTLLR